MKLEELSSVLHCGKVMANYKPYLVSESKCRSTEIPNGEVFLEHPVKAAGCRMLQTTCQPHDCGQHSTTFALAVGQMIRVNQVRIATSLSTFTRLTSDFIFSGQLKEAPRERGLKKSREREREMHEWVQNQPSYFSIEDCNCWFGAECSVWNFRATTLLQSRVKIMYS